MKKYIVNLMILFVMQSCGAMELAKLSSEDDKKCFRVARYLHKYPKGKSEEENEQIILFYKDKAPNRALLAECVKNYREAFDFVRIIPAKTIIDPNAQNIFDQILLDKKRLNFGVQQKIELLEEDSPLLALAFNKDVFVAQCKHYFPESFEDIGGFFNADFYEKSNNAENHVYLPLGGMIKKPINSSLDKKISSENMIKKLLQMPITEAFFAFRYVTQRNMLKVEDRFEKITQDGCLKGGQRYKQAKSGALSAEDLKHLSEEQENLLKDILEKSNSASKDSEYHPLSSADLFEIKDGDIKVLKSIKAIRDLDCFKDLKHPCNEALIYIKCRPSTIMERIKDKILFVGPHFLAVVMPDVINMQIVGFKQGIAGLFAAGLGGHLFGHPSIDTYHSSRNKLSEFFGIENQASVDRRWLCFVSIAHYISRAIAQKIWTWKTIPCQLIAALIYAARGCFVFLIHQTEDYNDPFKRANKKRYHYTLGDLIRGPKFDEK